MKKKPLKPGRKPIADYLKRNHHVRANFNEAEYTLLLAKAQRQSLAVFLRERALS